MTRWREVLVDFSRLERVLGRIPLSAAVSALRELADRTVFQPQSGDARVQVMGQLEAQGLSFDALWVTGIDDERFPAASRPHPFIPHPLQRARALPHASAERELRSEEHTSELQSLMRISYAVFCLKKKNNHTPPNNHHV